MRRHWFGFYVVAALFWAGAAWAEPVKSPAELFPANTVAYAELREPGKLVAEIRRLFKGSLLGNVPESLAKLRQGPRPDNYRAGQQQEWLGLFGLMLSPEIVAEAHRLKGAAIALTGLEKNGEPRFVAVILPGKSQAPAFLMRMTLTMAPMRPSTTVEGVTLYRAAFFGPINRGARPKQGAAAMREIGPAVAMMPGILFIGSPDAVKDAIRRAKGKAEGESLAKSAVFQEALHEIAPEPGLVAYGNVSGVMKLVEEHVKRHVPREALTALSRLINPKAFRAVRYSLTLNKGQLRYRKVALLDDKEKSPLVELLPTKPANEELLHFVPKDAIMLGVVSNSEGAQRWARFLELADAIAKQSGHEDHLPSAMVKHLEGQLDIDLGTDVIGKITNIGFGMGNPFLAMVNKAAEQRPDPRMMQGGLDIPMVLVIETADEGTAQKFVEKTLPHAFALIARQKILEPTVKETNGHKVYSVKMGRLGGVYFGRHGKVVVLGVSQAAVAQSLAMGADSKGWLAVAKRAARIRASKEAVVVGAIKPVTFMAGSLMWLYTSVAVERRAVERERQPAQPMPPRNGPSPTRRRAARGPLRDNRGPPMFLKEMNKLLAREEPVVLSLTRKKDRIIAEAQTGDLRPLVPGLVDFFLNQMVRSVGIRGGRIDKTIREEQPVRPRQ